MKGTFLREPHLDLGADVCVALCASDALCFRTGLLSQSSTGG